LARCYSPRVAEMFWSGAETVDLAGRTVKLPCPTDQFFHVCVHAMHWEWTPNLHWVADALTVLGENRGKTSASSPAQTRMPGDAEVDWDRAEALAMSAGMRVHFAEALSFLASRFHAEIPSHARGVRVQGWERRDYELLQKPCPLGWFDSALWHLYHFRRLRPFDAEWRSTPAFIGFPQYLATFLDAPTRRELLAGLWRQLKLRSRK